jgi:dihydroorotase
VSTEREPFDLLVTGAQLALPGGIRAGAVGINAGRIAALLEPTAAAEAKRVVEADGLTALPGLFDMHVHFRDPGYTHKETFETGSAAAAAGGFTGIADMPNTDPPTTTAERLLDKEALASGSSHVDFALWGGAGSAEHVAELADAGAVGVKVYLGLEAAADAHSDAPPELVVADDAAFYEILEAAAKVNVLVAVHCANQALRSRSRRSWRGKGFAQLKSEIVAEPQLHKVEAVCRTLLLAEESGARVHIVHVPAPALPHVALAKERGVAVTAEAALPFVTHDVIEEIGELGFDRYRSVEDARQIWTAVRDGTVDVLATDHAPHTLKEKRAGQVNLLASPSGYPELDTALPMLLDAVNRGLLMLQRLVEVMSFAPARILRLSQKGALRVGADADLVLVDLKREAVIERSRLRSKAGWSPFEGRRLTGWPVRTFLRGREIAREGQLSAGPPGGRFLPGSASNRAQVSEIEPPR